MNQKIGHIRRILVALDTSPHSHAALEAAAYLAAQLEAHLMGVYVEDVNLLRLAQLPFVREIRYASATSQKLDEVMVEKQLRSQASRARDDLRQVAEAHALEWSFRVLRGMVSAELLTAAMEADLLVLGRTGRQSRPRNQLGSTARMAVMQHQCPVLLIPPIYNLNQPPLLLYDGSAMANRALLMAVALAKPYGRFAVLLVHPDETIAQQWRQTIHAQLAGEKLQTEYRTVLAVAELPAILSQMDFSMILAGQAESPLSRAVIESLFQAGEQPVLIVQ
jgi:nucleotide-binding universal stress UspA family protein